MPSAAENGGIRSGEPVVYRLGMLDLVKFAHVEPADEGRLERVEDGYHVALGRVQQLELRLPVDMLEPHAVVPSENGGELLPGGLTAGGEGGGGGAGDEAGLHRPRHGVLRV